MSETSANIKPNGRPHPVTSQKPRPTTVGGADCVLVPLSGKHGIGKDALVNAADWDWVERRYGASWVRMVTPHDRRGRIVSGRTAIASEAKQKARAPVVSLARIIAAAEPGDRVFVLNGNTLDLRYDNLAALSNDTIAAFMANLNKPADEQPIEVG